MILDCTLRDGGYYLDWDFDEDLVCHYLLSLKTARVDVIEIGYRFLPRDTFLGAFAYCTEEYLNVLNLPEDIPLAVMVDASEIIHHNSSVESTLRSLFCSKADSKISIVRIATRVETISQCQEIVRDLNELGYRVFLNLMQIDSVGDNELVECVKFIGSWGGVEVLYFADSLGNMGPVDVHSLVDRLRKYWPGKLGIHAHDNKGQALANAMTAYELGVEYIDGTVYGMGRGAGNAKTEYLLLEIMQRGGVGYYPDAIFPLVLNEFERLKQQYQWGGNIYYYLSALYGIHPTYIQEFLAGGRYDTEQIISAINCLKLEKISFFSQEKMARAAMGVVGDEKDGSWSAKGWLEDELVLIVGAGPSSKKYSKQLELFARQHNAVVLCLNVNDSIQSQMVDVYVACHETRIFAESTRYKQLGKPVMLPMSRMSEGIRQVIDGVEILDYGLRVSQNSYEIRERGCVIGASLALGYAMSAVTAGGARKILFAGIDGYSDSDVRQKELLSLLRAYEEIECSLPLVSITPTTLPLKISSLFAFSDAE